MLILIDSGSSHLHIGWWEHNQLVEAQSHPYPATSDELRQFMNDIGIKKVVDGAAACSVSSIWRQPVFDALAELFPDTLRIARTAGDVGVRVPYDNSETYGIDRALAVYAAYSRCQSSCVVADAGTALTVDAVNTDGSVAGGFIIPGAALQVSSLAMATSLPLVSMVANEAPLGTSTEACIQLGIRYGYTAAVNDLLNRAAAAVQAGDRMLLTGGCAPLLSMGLSQTHEVVPNLVLEGLGRVFERLSPFT